MLRKRISLIALAIISCCHAPLARRAADDSANIRGIVDAAIRPVMAEYDVPGMAVALTVDGRPMFFNYGVASRENNSPVSEETLFEIGSDSKTFTATLASYAQALGKLSLDDRPGKYMPQLEGSAIDNVSLLNLGTFTAGDLPLQFPDEVSDNGRMIDYFRQWKPVATPGAQRRYSNPSIGLLGHITGLAMKSDFADAVETQLFPKLGLHHSYVRVPQSAMANYAWGYSSANKPIRVNPGTLDAEAYGIKSTAADMIRFVQANIEPSRLEGAMQRAIEGTHVGFFNVGEMVQGLGWEQYPYPVTLERLQAGNSSKMALESNAATRLTPPHAPSGPTLFNKTGSTNGFGAYIAFVPEKKIGIVMLANRNFPIPARVKAAHAILDQLASIAK
ncbi:MAG TPA: class C beta-lactamase [Burkholderiales bacterium]|nr:class C beta-lactamase [Burkholderiales bacterium]